MENLTIRDAFKSLEDIDDIVVEVKPTNKRQIKESLTESYIYLFPDEEAMGDYKNDCKKFGLEYLGKNEFEGYTNLVIRGSKNNLKKYADWLSYDLHPDYLYDEDEFAGIVISPSGKKYYYDDPNGSVDESKAKVNEAPVYDLSPDYDSRQSFYGKAKVDAKDNGVQVCKSYGTPVALIKDGKAYLLQGVINYYGYRTSATTLRHVKEFLKQNGFKAESLKQIEADYPVIRDYETYQSMIRESVETEPSKEPLKESEFVNVNDKEEIAKGKEVLEKGKEDDKEEEQIVDVDAQTIGELKDSYIGNVILQCPICRTLFYKKPDALEKSDEEDVYNKEEECPHCGAKEGYFLVGQVASLEVGEVEKEETTGTDVSKMTDEDAPEVETKEETEEEEVTFESLDEARFNRLVNKYVKDIYENVEKYESTNGFIDDTNNKLVVEGVITYKSGKTANTKFVFECISMNKNKQVKFRGLNETFTKAKKPFTLVGKVRNNTLKCESLNYNYNVKVNEELKKVKGKVHILNK